MKKTHAILLTTAMAAAYGAGELDIADLPGAQAGVSVVRPLDVSFTFPRAQFAGKTQLQMANAICAEAGSEYDLTGACSIANVRNWCVRSLDRDGGALDPVEIRGVIRRTMLMSDAE